MGPNGAHRNHDGLHRSGQPGGHAAGDARIPDDLCGRRDAVRPHVRLEPGQHLAARSLSSGVFMTAFDPGVARPWRQRLDSLFKALALLVMLLALASLGALIYDVFSDGASRLSWDFVTSFSSRRAENAGILHA